MTDQEAKEYIEILRRAHACSPMLRLGLVQAILDSLRRELKPRGKRATPLKDLLAKVKSKQKGPPPDDETVKRMIHEHRMRKYG